MRVTLGKPTVFASAQDLLAHLEGLGLLISTERTWRDGPTFTELDHGLQTAAILEREHPDDQELQVAGLIHDLAHPWDVEGQPFHGELGAKAIRPLLGSRIAALVEGHVPAKRYLATVRPEYRQQLSPGSIATLRAQGGDLDGDEVAAFEARAEWHAMVQLRMADDRAKVPGAIVPGLDHWRPIVVALASR
jgi:predicted HD phosphohydrolase